MVFRVWKSCRGNPPASFRSSEACAPSATVVFLVSAALLIFSDSCLAQVNYVARFVLEKETFLLGEPIFCDFVIQNTGTQVFGFSYRPPSRVLNRELEPEPHFRLTDERGHLLPDPAPKPCGGAKGSVVYGSVSLPPGRTQTERWLLNEWARFSAPGLIHVRAERRLPLSIFDPATQKFMERPAAYALAVNEFVFRVVPSTEEQLDAAFRPYVNMLEDPSISNPFEAVTVLTTLPRSFLAKKFEAMATASPQNQRWDRKQVLEGLARLNTLAAWEAMLRVARGSSGDESLRAYAVLLLAEKGDGAPLPGLLEMVKPASATLRGAILRSLGFFHDPRANRVLFEELHSGDASDRMNAILGLKNLESREAIPALLAMLNDPDPQVRQVANFALQSLTGQRIELSAKASQRESARVAQQWHAWWREKGAQADLVRQPPCHDW